jgi:copper homeostasis protein
MRETPLLPGPYLGENRFAVNRRAAMAILEVCVDSPGGLAAAVTGGADRIELCSALELGGLSPGAGLMMAARDAPVPVMVMVRPRAGDFRWSAQDVAASVVEVETARAQGFAGVVIGASAADGSLDVAVLRRLVEVAGEMEVTLHRAVDLAPDPVAAVRQARHLGLRRILTSGGAARAVDGEQRLRAMCAAAGTGCEIMPGAGLTAENAPGLLHRLGLREVHASCSTPRPSARTAVAFGFAAPHRRETSVAAVRAMKEALTSVP